MERSPDHPRRMLARWHLSQGKLEGPGRLDSIRPFAGLRDDVVVLQLGTIGLI